MLNNKELKEIWGFICGNITSNEPLDGDEIEQISSFLKESSGDTQREEIFYSLDFILTPDNRVDFYIFQMIEDGGFKSDAYGVLREKSAIEKVILKFKNQWNIKVMYHDIEKQHNISMYWDGEKVKNLDENVEDIKEIIKKVFPNIKEDL